MYTEIENCLYQNNCTYYQTGQVLAQLNPNFKPAVNGNASQELGSAVPWLKQTTSYHVFLTKKNPVSAMCSYKPKKDEILKIRSWYYEFLFSLHHHAWVQHGRAVFVQFKGWISTPGYYIVCF